MKFFGIKIPKHPRFVVNEWVDMPARILCTAQTPEEQMQCTKYKAATKSEIQEMCPSAPEFSCRFCDCGCSDTCSVTDRKLFIDNTEIYIKKEEEL